RHPETSVFLKLPPPFDSICGRRKPPSISHSPEHGFGPLHNLPYHFPFEGISGSSGTIKTHGLRWKRETPIARWRMEGPSFTGRNRTSKLGGALQKALRSL